MTENRSVLERIKQQVPPPSPAFERLERRRARKARNTRIASATLALAVSALAIGGAVVALRPSADQPPTGPGQTIEADLVAGPGEYYYSKALLYLRDYECDGCQGSKRLLGPWTFELWFGPDASGRYVFVESPDPKGSVGYGWNGPKDATYGPGEMPLEDLSNLSSAPAELRAQLTERSLPGGASPNPIATTSPGRTQEDTSLLRTFEDLFKGAEQFTPPVVRAAMFEVARRIEGVETIPQTTDPAGRTATSLRWIIQYDGPPSIVEWYFDPSTKQLMATTSTQGGLLLEARVVTAAGIVGSRNEVPGPNEEFFPPVEGEPTPVGT